MELSCPPRPSALPPQAHGVAHGAAPGAAPLACRPIGRLQRDEVVILVYELWDRGTGTLRGYQSVVLSRRAAAHA